MWEDDKGAEACGAASSASDHTCSPAFIHHIFAGSRNVGAAAKYPDLYVLAALRIARPLCGAKGG